MIRLILASSLLAFPAVAQTTYDAPGTAHHACPKDQVVWLNTNSGIYHFVGERWYGRTKDGAYVCRHEADAAGDRATENEQ